MNSCKEDLKKMQSILAKLKINCIGIYDCEDGCGVSESS
jgi:hypothetical protein